MSETIAELVRIVVDNELNSADRTISDETRFAEDLEADSLDMVSLAMELERRFAIDIPDQELEKLKTVGDAIALVQRTAFWNA